MSKRILVSIVVLCMAGLLQASPTVFDFNSLNPMDDSTAVDAYMSSVYGSSITTVGTRVGPAFSNMGFGEDPYLFSDMFSGGTFDIYFNAESIVGAEFEGMIFRPEPGAIFQIKAYNGSDEVWANSWSSGAGSFSSGWMNFGAEVDHLWFSDHSILDVGLDDLAVERAGTGNLPSAPAPGAILLGSLGIALVGFLRRREVL